VSWAPLTKRTILLATRNRDETKTKDERARRSLERASHGEDIAVDMANRGGGNRRRGRLRQQETAQPGSNETRGRGEARDASNWAEVEHPR
jgi:hypothetical protein